MSGLQQVLCNPFHIGGVHMSLVRFHDVADEAADLLEVGDAEGPRTSAALRSNLKAENIKVTGRLESDTKSHLMGQASASPSTTAAPSSSSTTTTQPGGATTSKTPPPPAATGSPSTPPQPAEKQQKP